MTTASITVEATSLEALRVLLAAFQAAPTKIIDATETTEPPHGYIDRHYYDEASELAESLRETAQQRLDEIDELRVAISNVEALAADLASQPEHRDMAARIRATLTHSTPDIITDTERAES